MGLGRWGPGKWEGELGVVYKMEKKFKLKKLFFVLRKVWIIHSFYSFAFSLGSWHLHCYILVTTEDTIKTF